LITNSEKFNNPDYHRNDKDDSSGKVIQHIEHYCNLGDFVSQIGVLNYTRVANRYMGRLFLSPESGHLLNQHYLHEMFRFGEDGRVLDSNAFMDMEVRLSHHDMDAGREDVVHALADNSGGKEFGGKHAEQRVAFVGDVNRNLRPMVLFEQGELPRRLKVKDFSRLWMYRNGGDPRDEED
jgi:hypothetical protein